jgi:uncharacterized Ntn-hydrolase superfamily protein
MFGLLMLGVILSVVAVVIVKGGGLAFFIKNRSQDDRIAKANERIDQLEKQYQILLDVVLESELVEANEFSKRLLTSR